MSSVGQALGYVGGAVVGSFFGMPMLGAAIGGMIGGAIDPPKGPNIVGPKLDDLSFQSSTLGAPLARGYGTFPVLGNVIWLEGDQYRAVTTTEEQGGKGGPTQTVETTAYYATFAVSLLRVTDPNATVSLRRLWLGSNLVFDAGSNNLESIIASNIDEGVNFTFYNGSDDQLPNPRWQADKGINAVSGMPGRCWILIEDLDLTKYSNSLAMAQVKAELVIANSPVPTIYNAEKMLLVAPSVSGSNGFYPRSCQISNSGASYAVVEFDYWNGYPKNTYFCTTAFSDFSRVDAVVDTTFTGYATDATRSLIVAQCDELASLFMEIDYGTTNVKIHITTEAGDSICQPILASQLFDYNSAGLLQLDGWACLIKGGTVYLFNRENSYAIVAVNLSGYVGQSSTTVQYSSAGFSENYIFCVAYTVSGTTTTVYKFDINLNLVDTFTQTVSDPYNAAITVIDDDTFYTATRGTAYKWVNGVVVDTLTGAVASDFSNEATELAGYFAVFNDHPLYCVSFTYHNPSTNHHFDIVADRVTPESALLRDIVTAECGLAGIASADLDLTGLTNSEVRGYRITERGSVRAALEPLQAAFPFDVAATGYKLRFKSRGGSSVATIPEEGLGTVATGEQAAVLLTVAREMDTQLPRKVSVRYLDVDREYDLGEQYAERPCNSVNERVVELPIVMNSQEAARTADVLLSKDWVERTEIGPFSLPPIWRALEAADVVTVEHRGQSRTVRLTRAEYLPDGRISCNAKLTASQCYTSTATGEAPAVIGQSLVPLRGTTAAYLLDIPRIVSNQDVPGMAFAMTGLASGWPGGALLRSDDSGQTYQSIGSTNTRARVFAAGAAIGSHHGYSIDHSAVLTLTPHISTHTLSSVTEEQLYSHTNLAAYGADGRWEIVSFKTVVDNGDDFTVRDFLRGLYGTEWATGLHQAGDTLIMLDAGAVGFFGLPINAIGSQRLYRAVTQGSTIDSAVDISDIYEANNIKPLSPTDVSGWASSATNDWTITASRRTRWPTEVFSGTVSPLGETSESYEVEVWGWGFSAVKRTLYGSTESLTYSSADQIADFGTNQFLLFLKIFQISSVAGRGNELAAVLSPNAPNSYLISAWAGSNVYHNAAMNYPAMSTSSVEYLQGYAEYAAFTTRFYSAGTAGAGSDSGVLATATLWFNRSLEYTLEATNGYWSGDRCSFTLEFLNAQGTCVACIKTTGAGNYYHYLYHGATVDTATILGTGIVGSYPQTGGTLRFTDTQMIYTNTRSADYNTSFTFNCDAKSISTVRISNVQSRSTYTGTAAAYVLFKKKNP